MSNSNPEDHSPPESDEEREAIVQRLERSLDFWIDEKEDYPPAIRGVMANVDDHRSDVQTIIQKIGRDKNHPDLVLKRVLWFEDKNEKLDEACAEAKTVFRPFTVNPDGLISTKDSQNPLLEKPSRHRLTVSDQFASENYQSGSDNAMIVDEDDEESTSSAVAPNSWKRKITQTLKPWSILKNNQVVHARPECDLILTLNSLLSRTRHGWLVADLFKLKHRRGAMLTYARTFEYQRKNDAAFEFKLELFGAAAEMRSRLTKTLENVACLFLEIDEEGETYLTKASIFQDDPSSPPSDSKVIPIPIAARVVFESGRPSQIVLKKSGAYYDSKLKPHTDKKQAIKTKIDLRGSNSDTKQFRFQLQVELDGPLLVASSGDALIFQLDDMLARFTGTSLASIRAQVSE